MTTRDGRTTRPFTRYPRISSFTTTWWWSGSGTGCVATDSLTSGSKGRPSTGMRSSPSSLQPLQQLRAHQDHPLQQRLARVAALGGLEGAVEVVEDVDELQQQRLVALREAALRGCG